MSKANAYPAFGSLFAMGATLVSPMHEAITSKPLHGTVGSRKEHAAVWSLIARAGAALYGWRERRAQRTRLALLNDHLLQDIGLTRHQVEEELRKPFWQ